MIKFTFASFLFLLVSFTGLSQYSISGSIINTETTKNLTGANIWLEGVNRTTTSDANGDFQIQNINEGTYTLRISFVGFEDYSNTLIIKENIQLEIGLSQKLYITEAVIVSATRANEKTPMTFTQVDKKTISKQNLGQDIPFLLNQTPSVVTTSDAGAGVGYTGIRIRGSDATRINVTLNGIPLNDSESQGVFWVNMPDFSSSVNDIQIQRGVGTSTNGAGAFGASVNIQTLNFNEKAYAQIDNSLGSFNTRKHNLQIGSGLINDKFTFDARLSKIYSDGYIDRAYSDLNSYFISGGYFGKNTLLKINIFSGNEVTYQSWNGVDVKLLETDRTYNSAGQTNDSTFYDNEVDDYGQDHYQAIFAHDFNDQFTINFALHYTHGAGFFEQYKVNKKFSDYGLENVAIGNDTIKQSDIIRRRWLNNDFYGFTYSLNYTPNTNTNIILGGAWNTYEGDHFGEVIWAKYASNGNIRHRYYDNVGEKKDFNSFLKIQHQLTDNLSLFGDAQFRRITYFTEGIDSDRRAIFEDVDFNFFNPKVGVMYNHSKTTSAYASFSIGNREPIRSDFIDAPTDKKPTHESLRNLEVGFKKAASNYNFQANYYWMGYKNQLVLTGELNDVGGSVRTNVPKSYRTGVELSLTYKPSKQWNINANVTFSQNKIEKFSEILYDYGAAWDEYNTLENKKENVDISFSPNIIAGTNISFLPIENLELTLLSKYVGRQYLDNTQNSNRQIDAYFVNDLRVIYEIKPKFMKTLNLSILVNNIFDTKYESNGYTYGYLGGGDTYRERFYYPQAGTNFLVAVSMRF